MSVSLPSLTLSAHWLAHEPPGPQKSPDPQLVPALMFPQVPFAPPVSAALQAWQALPEQLELQQKPLAQKPLRHCMAEEQTVPVVCRGAQVFVT
jgi:hypothetical protein